MKKYNLFSYSSDSPTDSKPPPSPNYCEPTTGSNPLASRAQYPHTHRTDTALTEQVHNNCDPARLSEPMQQEDPTTAPRHRRPNARNSPFQTVDGLCGVSAKSSGLVSFGIQAVALLICCLLTAIIFLHIGGLKWLFTNTRETQFAGLNASTPGPEADSDILPVMLTSPAPPILPIGFPGSSVLQLDSGSSNTSSVNVTEISENENFEAVLPTSSTTVDDLEGNSTAGSEEEVRLACV